MSCAKNCSTKSPGARNARRQSEFTEEGGPQNTKFDSPNFNRYEDFKRIARTAAQSSFIEKPPTFSDSYSLDQSSREAKRMPELSGFSPLSSTLDRSSRRAKRIPELSGFSPLSSTLDQSSRKATRSPELSGFSPLDDSSFRSSFGRPSPREEADTSGGTCFVPQSESSGYEERRSRTESFCQPQTSSAGYSRSRQGSRSPTRASSTCPGSPQAHSSAIAHSGSRSPTRRSGGPSMSMHQTTTEYSSYPDADLSRSQSPCSIGSPRIQHPSNLHTQLPSDSAFGYAGSGPQQFPSRISSPGSRSRPSSAFGCPGSPRAMSTPRGPPSAQRRPALASYDCPGSARPVTPRSACGPRSSSPGPPQFSQTTRKQVIENSPGKRYRKITEFKTMPLDTTSSMEVSIPQSCSGGLDQPSYSDSTNFTTCPADDSFPTLPGSYGGSFKTLQQDSIAGGCGGTFKTLPQDSYGGTFKTLPQDSFGGSFKTIPQDSFRESFKTLQQDSFGGSFNTAPQDSFGGTFKTLPQDCSQLSVVSEEGSECMQPKTTPRPAGSCGNKTYSTGRSDKSQKPSKTTRNKTVKHTPEGDVITEEVEELYDGSSCSEKKRHKKRKEYSSASKSKCTKKRSVSEESSETGTGRDKKCNCGANAGNICLLTPQYCMISPQLIPHMSPTQIHNHYMKQKNALRSHSSSVSSFSTNSTSPCTIETLSDTSEEMYCELLDKTNIPNQKNCSSLDQVNEVVPVANCNQISSSGSKYSNSIIPVASCRPPNYGSAVMNETFPYAPAGNLTELSTNENDSESVKTAIKTISQFLSEGIQYIINESGSKLSRTQRRPESSTTTAEMLYSADKTKSDICEGSSDITNSVTSKLCEFINVKIPDIISRKLNALLPRTSTHTLCETEDETNSETSCSLGTVHSQPSVRTVCVYNKNQEVTIPMYRSNILDQRENQEIKQLGHALRAWQEARRRLVLTTTRLSSSM